MIVYQCPSCAVTHRAPPVLAGRRIRCSRCGVEDVIPAQSTVTLPAAESDGTSDEKPRCRKSADAGTTRTKEPAGKTFPWVMAAMVGVAVLVFVSAGLWQFLGRDGDPSSGPDSERIAKDDPPLPVVPADKGDRTKDTKGAKTKEPETKGPAKKEPPETKPAAIAPQKVRAAVLLAEYRAAPAATDRKYAGRLLEVQGPFARLVTSIPGRKDAAGPFVQLAEKDGGPFVTFVLDPATPREVWQAVKPGQSVTLRGAYAKGLALERAEAIRLQAPGDDLYKGKVVELTGIVERFVRGTYHADGFPALQLEPDAVDSVVRVECLFKRNDEKLLEGVRVGKSIVVRGTCGGRDRGVVRLHNCQLVPADELPTLGVVRVTVRRFTRLYEADLRDDAAVDDAPPFAVSAEELTREFTIDAATATARFRGKALEITGAVEAIDPQTRSVTFERNTDQRVRVVCRFTPSRFAEVVREPVLTIRGLCRGLSGPVVRLEGCDMIEGASTERLGAAYYPFVLGRTLLFDQARVSGKGEHRVVRQRLTFRDGGRVEIASIRGGVLKKRSLFDSDNSVSWQGSPIERSGTTVLYRLRGGFVEIGLSSGTKVRKSETVWEPILKGGARVGATWTWNGPGGLVATYTLDRFTEHRGLPAAVITRKVPSKDRGKVIETVHLYVKGVGEVERRTYENVPRTKTRKLIEEMRLAEWPE